MRTRLSRCSWQLIPCQSILLKLGQCLLTCCCLITPDQPYCLLWLLAPLARLRRLCWHIKKMACPVRILRSYCASHILARMIGSCKDQTLSRSSLCPGRKCCSDFGTSLDRLCPISAEVSLALKATAPPFSWSLRRSSASLTPRSSCPCSFKLWMFSQPPSRQ